MKLDINKTTELSQEEKIQLIDRLIQYVKEQEEDTSPSFLCYGLCQLAGFTNYDKNENHKKIMLAIKNQFPELYKGIRRHQKEYLKERKVEIIAAGWDEEDYSGRLLFLSDLRVKICEN